MMKKFVAAAAVASLSVSPALAATAPASTKLSVGNGLRASTPSANRSRLDGGTGFVGLAILAGIAAIGVIAIINGSDDDNADSN